MTLSFPNAARSFDEAKQRVRFVGHDGMFEVRFFVAVDALDTGLSSRTASERDYLAAFDGLRNRILDVARKVYASDRKDTIMLDARDF